MSKLNQDQELMSSILAKEWHTLYAEEIILVMNYAKEQQAKIDELQKLRGLDEIAINQIAHANQQWQLKCDELQNRINEALEDLEYPTAPWDETIASVVKVLRGES